MYLAALFTWVLMETTRAQKYMPTCLELCNDVHSVNSRLFACNCEGLEQNVDLNSSYEIGNNGIVYLPVPEFNPNVQNPITNSNHNQNLGLQLYDKYADLSMLKSEKNRIKKQSDEDVQTTSTKPLYIDIQIRKTKTSATFSNEADTDTNHHGKEKYLQECLDIHTVLHSRRSQAISKPRENWDAEKLDKYINLSDADLLRESYQKCAYPHEVVKQSINEIKQSLPTKLDGGKLRIQNSVDHHSYRDASSILPDMTVDIKSSSSSNFMNNSDISTSVVTDEKHISSNEHKRNSSKIISEKVDDARPLAIGSSGIEANGTEYIKDNLEKVTTVSTSLINDASTNKSQFVTNETNSTSKNQKEGIHRESELNNSTANPIHETATDELTSMVTDMLVKPYYESTTLNNSESVDYNDDEFQNETSQFKLTTEVDNNTAIQTTTVTNCINSNKCIEPTFTKNDFPEIEHRNNVNAVSTDDLFEVASSTITPFIIPTITVTKSGESIDITVATTPYAQETTTEGSVDVTEDNSISKTLKPDFVENASVTGGIYFNYRNQHIPARFIQDPVGRVSISIDVIALCDKLNLANNGSLLIGVMCKCVQSKTCV